MKNTHKQCKLHLHFSGIYTVIQDTPTHFLPKFSGFNCLRKVKSKDYKSSLKSVVKFFFSTTAEC